MAAFGPRGGHRWPPCFGLYQCDTNQKSLAAVESAHGTDGDSAAVPQPPRVALADAEKRLTELQGKATAVRVELDELHRSLIELSSRKADASGSAIGMQWMTRVLDFNSGSRLVDAAMGQQAALDAQITAKYSEVSLKDGSLLEIESQMAAASTAMLSLQAMGKQAEEEEEDE